MKDRDASKDIHFDRIYFRAKAKNEKERAMKLDPSCMDAEELQEITTCWMLNERERRQKCDKK
jgi:hypothetical protein